MCQARAKHLTSVISFKSHETYELNIIILLITSKTTKVRHGESYSYVVKNSESKPTLSNSRAGMQRDIDQCWED